MKVEWTEKNGARKEAPKTAAYSEAKQSYILISPWVMEYLENYVLQLGVCHLLHKFIFIQHLNTQTLSGNWGRGLHNVTSWLVSQLHNGSISHPLLRRSAPNIHLKCALNNNNSRSSSYRASQMLHLELKSYNKKVTDLYAYKA